MNYLQLASIALNVYNNDPTPKGFAKLKQTENKTLSNGLYCCVYEHLSSSQYILVIKGTSSFDDLKADIEFTLNLAMKEFNELRLYIDRLLSHYSLKLSVITGHSLGGILSKMIVGTKQNLCDKVLAFNSPGVRVSAHCRIETVVAVGDEIGHFSSNNDSGKYISVPILAQTKLERVTERIVPALSAAGTCALATSPFGPVVAGVIGSICGMAVEGAVIYDEHQMKNLFNAMSTDDRFKREF